MLKKETLQTAARAAIVFGVAFLIVGTSQTFQSCMGEHYQHEPSETFEEGFSQLFIAFKVGSACAGEFIHKIAESIIAFFTVILGVATWALWRATQKLVEGAEDTGKRQLRAYLIVEGTNIESKPGKFISHFRIENTGQTPAHHTHIISKTCVLLHSIRRDFNLAL